MPRRGVVVVLTGFCLVAVFAFVALSVDTSRMVLTETRMQNAVDAAALAAAQEISAAVYAAGQGQGSANVDGASYAVTQARSMAAQVAAANGVFIDQEADVRFGRRNYNAATGDWPISWGESPYNVVQVVARKTDADVSAPDGQLPLAFGWAVGRSKVPLKASATAFVESRDLVVVLDFSGSMNYDSQLTSSLGVSEAEGLLDNMWNAMVAANPKWPGTSTSKFPATGFGEIDSYEGMYISSSDTATIRSSLGLTANQNGIRKYPYPQAGRTSDGLPKSKPSNSTSDALWGRYIDFVKNHPVSSYRKKYGYRTLMDFLQQKTTNGFTPRERYASEDMWRTPHYPMHGVKKGTTLFLEFLHELNFGDEVGLVGYGEWAEPIWKLNDGVISVDITSNPITVEFDQLDLLQRHHQAGEFNGQTAMGDGIEKGRELLVGDDGSGGYARYGARSTMLIMTDGQTNQRPNSWSLPYGFDWAEWTDYDGDGSADYSTSDKNKQHAFYEATKCADRGITLHTMAVGADADNALMKAIAFAGGGVYVSVPGGTTVSELDSQLEDAFRSIASKVPTAKLIYNESDF
jgi:hypothetical protein